MADWDQPLTTTDYADVLSELKDRDTSAALMFDGTSESNLPVGTIRWNSSSHKFQKWDGSVWEDDTGRLDITDSLSSLTSAEATQLTKIGSVTISNTQWTYLGDFNQSLTTTSSVAFASISVSGSVSIVGQASVGGLDSSGNAVQCSKLRLDESSNSNLESSGEIIYDPSDGIYYVRQGSVEKLWDTSNHGAGSGLDADLLDGQQGSYYNDTPNETRTVFYQASAPTGWTQITSVNDRVLRVVSGTGGSTGGSWTISGLTVDGHALTLGQIPRHRHGGGNHNHSYRRVNTGTGGNTYGGNNYPVETVNTGNSGNIINYEGNDEEHGHGLTADGSWRPSYINIIVCERNK